MKEWAHYRWQDEVLSVLWLYDRIGDATLLDFARRLAAQGYDWSRHFADFAYPNKVTKAEANKGTHVVNNAMALKAPALSWLMTGRDRAAATRPLEVLDRHHLLPSGVHSGDEHYAGRDPSQGTELCAVVEGMFSVEHLLAIVGDPALGDRLEKIAFNALPAAFSGDMWAHQYDQQPNQVLVSLEPRQWTTNGRESNLFGLEPNFGCCTANFHQGWPKLVASLWMATPDARGLVAAAYGPSEVRTLVAGDVPVTIVEETEYPFKDRVTLTITPARAVTFPLVLRVPAWARGATLGTEPLEAGTFHRIERTWQPGDRVVLTFPLAPRFTPWDRSVVVERGPLVFALRIGEEWRKVTEGMTHPAVAPAADWEVRPTTPWNYGLAEPGAVAVRERALGPLPFSRDGAPVEIVVRARRIPTWTIVEGSAGAPPIGARTSEPTEDVTLIPYGAAKLRVTAFPTVSAP